MPDFLSEEWYEHAATVLGASDDPVSDQVLRLQFEITGTPDGKVRPSAIVDDGRLVSISADKVAKPHCKVICDLSVAEAMLAGDLDPNVAYMRGDLKLDGEYARVLYDLRPMLRSDPFQAVVKDLLG